jgi:hypothetical protein
MRFDRLDQMIARPALAPGPVADRRILPKGADFVYHWNTQLFPNAERRQRIEHRRMRVQQIGLPLLDQRFGPRGERPDLAPFAERRRRGCDRRGTMKSQPVDGLDRGTRDRVAHAGNARNVPALRDLRLHQRAGAKRVAAMRGQAVIEDVKYAGHRPSLCHTTLNGTSTPLP